MTVCTRFAPSPTGHLHIGGARTALFAWLYARAHQGKFILRIEDTDVERSKPEFTEAILTAMQWLGLNYDDEPYYQSQRMPRYLAAVERLITEDKAYRCYCSKERLQALREAQIEQKQKPRYDRHCRDLTHPQSDAPHVVRFKTPLDGVVRFDDQVYGSIAVQNQELDDVIILRSDGSPTYNLTVVVDDCDMGITHVIRGDDHINNTPRQINILSALNAPIPIYAHLPMLLGPDGARLSKRHGAVSVLQYRDQGYLPQALLNYLVRLGWSHGDQEIFSLDEMRAQFNLKAINKTAASFNLEKLVWLNQHYLKNLPKAEIIKQLSGHFQQLAIDITQGPDLPQLLDVLLERSKTLRDLAEQSRCYYQPITEYNAEAAAQYLHSAIIEPITAVKAQLMQLPLWQADVIKNILNTTVKTYGLKFPQLAQPLRIALTGNTNSPSIDVTLALLGKATSLQRLDQLLEYLAKT